VRLLSFGIVSFGLLLFTSTAGADEPACPAAVTAERRAADRMVKGGEAAGALARLEAVRQLEVEKDYSVAWH
jgi:hypothetical protein